MSELVFALPELAEAATINIGGTLYPTSILVERREGSIHEGEAGRVDHLQTLVLRLVAKIERLETGR